MPELTEGTFCGADLPGVGSRVQLDDFVLITHSLGSRATLDAMQRLTNLPVSADPHLKEIADTFATRDIQVFMLSNQLPLLEAGREGQQVVNQVGAYCGPGATKPGKFFDKTEIIAFSDPNDLMSYPVPDKFARQLYRITPVPERHQRHHQRGRGELAARPGRCRQPAQRASRLRRRRAGRCLARPRCRQPQRGTDRGRPLHLARDRREPDALNSRRGGIIPAGRPQSSAGSQPASGL